MRTRRTLAATSFKAVILGLIAALLIGSVGFAQSDRAGITFWRSFDGVAAEAQEELVRRFIESEPTIDVTASFQGYYLDVSQKLMAAIAARRLPDLVTLDTGLAVPFARDGLLQPLDELLDGPNGLPREQFAPGMLEAGQVDGVQYLIPFAVSVPVLYYNPAMLAEAGVAAPPETWDELFETTRAVRAHFGEGAFGLTYEIRFWWLQSQIWAQGGDISDNQYNTFIDGDVWVQHLTQLRDLVVDEHAVNVPPKAAGGMQADFASGRAAMMVASSAQLANLLAAVGDNFQLGVAQIPGGPAGRVAPLGGSGLVIPAGLPAEQVQAAWAFLRYMVSPESNAYFASSSGYLPITDEAVTIMEPFLTEHPLWRVAISELPYARQNSELHDTRDGQPVINNAMERILLRGEDPAVVLPQAQKELDAAIREEGLR